MNQLRDGCCGLHRQDSSNDVVCMMVISFQSSVLRLSGIRVGCGGPLASWLLRRAVWAVSQEALASSPRCKLLQRQFWAVSREASAALPPFLLGRRRDGQTFQEEAQAQQVTFKKEGISNRLRSCFFHSAVFAAEPSAGAHAQHGTPHASTH